MFIRQINNDYYFPPPSLINKKPTSISHRKSKYIEHGSGRNRGGGGGGSDLIATLFSNTQVFGEHAISVELSATSFENSQSFGSHTISTEIIIAPSSFSNSQSFGDHAISVELEATSFANIQTFGDHSLDVTLEPTSFTNTQTFGEPVISVELVATSFTNSQTFGSHTIVVEGGLEPTHFTNVQTFGDHSISVDLTATSFANVQAFGSHGIANDPIEPTSFTNVQTFGEPSISVELMATSFTNTQSFGSHMIEEALPGGGFLRPDGVVAAGGWTAVNAADIPTALNEDTPDNTDYAETGTNPSTDVLEVSLSDVGDPGIHVGHFVRYNYGKSASAGAQIDITVALIQGTSTIASQAHTDVAVAPVEGTFALTEGEMNSITDYTDLRLRFTANKVGGGAARAARVTWAEVEVLGAFKEGFNFRATEEYVTDPADSQFVDLDDVYPVTSGDVTFGWTVAAGAVRFEANRDDNLDARLAGIHVIANSVTHKFRVDLPASGDYRIRLALGDGLDFDHPNRVRIVDSDDSTVLEDIVGDTDGTNFIDATGVARTFAAWPGDNATVTVTFTGTTAFFWVGGHSGGTENTCIAHLEIEAV